MDGIDSDHHLQRHDQKPEHGGPLLPGGGMSTIGSDFSFEDRLKHLILPASVLIFFNLGTHVRYTRSGMLDVLHQDYIRTAHAKGLNKRTVILKHALRNSLLPLITIIGLELPGLFNGALITETIFSWPGMGRLFFNSIDRADYSVMMGVLLMNAIMIVLSGLLTDIVYGFFESANTVRLMTPQAKLISDPTSSTLASMPQERTMRELVWNRFRQHRAALLGVSVLTIIIAVDDIRPHRHQLRFA